MDVSGGKPGDPLEQITKALAVSSTEGPMNADQVPRRTGSPYLPGLLWGSVQEL